MSFAARETSRSLAVPDTLYRFTYQDKVYRYCDAEDPITFGGETYEPVPVNRDAVTTSGTLDKAALKIQLPRSTDVAELFRVFPPSDVVSVVIYQGHAFDPDSEFLAVWSGRVLSGGRDGALATLMCEPVSTSMRRPGLRRRYQYGCPHALYGPQCRVVRELFTVEAEVAVVSGQVLTFAAGWAGSFEETRFLDGMVEWTTSDGATEFRTILRVDAALNNITLAGRMAGLEAGTTVKLSLGCNHLLDGCAVFANEQNFGGQPWIPKKSPLGFVNQFY